MQFKKKVELKSRIAKFYILTVLFLQTRRNYEICKTGAADRAVADSGRALSLPFFNEELSKLNPRDFVYEHNLDGSKTLNIICHSGSRSQRAAELFEKNGFFNVAVVDGGLVEAEREGLRIVRH